MKPTKAHIVSFILNWSLTKKSEMFIKKKGEETCDCIICELWSKF